MESFPGGKAAIVGAATYGLGEAPGFTPLELASRAALKASGIVKTQLVQNCDAFDMGKKPRTFPEKWEPVFR